MGVSLAVADLMTSVAESAASEVGSFAGGAILNLVLGIEDGGNSAAVLQSLQEINTKLGLVESGIQDIQRSIAQLDKQFKQDLQNIQIDISQQQLADAKSTIETHFGTTPIVGLQSFLGAATGGSGTGHIVPRSQLSTFARNTLGTWDIAKHPRAISQALVGGTGTSKGLLENWTNLFIMKFSMGGNRRTLFEYYCILETYFEQYLALQAKALCILVNAYNYSESGVRVGTAAEYQSQSARDYVSGVFAPSLRSQIGKFLFCAERLAFSQWDFSKIWQSDVPTLALPQGSEDILERAELVATAYLASIGDRSPRGGLCARSIVRPSLVIGDRGPSLNPTGTRASTGFVERNHTVKTIDGSWDPSSVGPSVLAPYEDSSIVVVRYYWPWGEGATVELPVGFVWRAESYDRMTRRPLSTATAESVRIGIATDVSQLYFDPLASLTGFNPFVAGALSFVTTKPGDIQTALGNVAFSVTHPEGLPLSLHTTITFPDSYDSRYWFEPLRMTLFKYVADIPLPTPISLTMKGRVRYGLPAVEYPSGLSYDTGPRNVPIPNLVASTETLLPLGPGESGPPDSLIDTRVDSPPLKAPFDLVIALLQDQQYADGPLALSSPFAVQRHLAIARPMEYAITVEFHVAALSNGYLSPFRPLELVLELDSMRFAWDQPAVELSS